jgi:hypothetical protein
MKVKQGQILAITTGAYSDYTLRDHVRALRDFDTTDEIARFMKEGDYIAPAEWDEDGPPSVYDSDIRFIAWAIRERLIEPLSENEVVEWHVGEYGELDVSGEE